MSYEYKAINTPVKGDAMHYGIPGQKWGNRRWQNEDGSLTPEGYEHYYGKKGLYGNINDPEQYKIKKSYQSDNGNTVAIIKAKGERKKINDKRAREQSRDIRNAMGNGVVKRVDAKAFLSAVQSGNDKDAIDAIMKSYTFREHVNAKSGTLNLTKAAYAAENRALINSIKV